MVHETEWRMACAGGTSWSLEHYGTGPCNVGLANVCPYNEGYENPNRRANGGQGQTENKEKCPFVDNESAT